MTAHLERLAGEERPTTMGGRKRFANPPCAACGSCWASRTPRAPRSTPARSINWPAWASACPPSGRYWTRPGCCTRTVHPPSNAGSATARSACPNPMRAELAVWFEVMRTGSTSPSRRRPRAISTIQSQPDFAMPALRAWAVDHKSLREIGREDFRVILPPAGTSRAKLIGGCRSVLQVLRGRRLVYTDPTRGIAGAKAESASPCPSRRRSFSSWSTATVPSSPRWPHCSPSTDCAPDTWSAT